MNKISTKDAAQSMPVIPGFGFELPTRIVFGEHSSKTLASVLGELNASRPLIVTDRGIAATGIIQSVCDRLGGSMEYRVYDGVEANPKDVNVEAGAKLARNFDADALVAIGGGSPIDCAKAIGVLLAHDAESIKPFEGKTAAVKPQPPLIAIPTTAGTGSETTFSSVINDTKNAYKMTIKGRYTAPTVAICDPVLTVSVPRGVTASTGVDALTHAIEAFTATCAEPISDALALYAIELISSSLRDAVNDGADIAARSRMLMGSLIAGMAFSHSDVASVHCVAESLGGVYDLPHGVCNAIFLPYVMDYSKEYCMERYARVAQAMGVSPREGQTGADAAVDAVKALVSDVGLPTFASLFDAEPDLERIAAMSAKNISTMSNPRPMDEADYLAVLKNAYKAAKQ